MPKRILKMESTFKRTFYVEVSEEFKDVDKEDIMEFMDDQMSDRMDADHVAHEDQVSEVTEIPEKNSHDVEELDEEELAEWLG